MTQVFLLYTNGSGATFPDPGNWNPVNKIECLGSGGAGGGGNNTGPSGGAGGGGAAYGYGNNVTVPSFPAPYIVIYGTQSADYITCWGSGNLTNSPGAYPSGPNIVYASSASGGLVSTSFGLGGSHFYPNGFAGGNGGTGIGSSGTPNGGGGGGSAGPHGAGSAGSNAVNSSGSFGAGGAADGGTIAGASTGSGAGTNGNAWDSTHGPGSGGAGSASATLAGGAGGQFGGGGGGGSGGTLHTGGDSGKGIIVLTYTPFVPILQDNAIVMA